MASRTLDITLSLKSGDPINGILTLDKVVDDIITYDDQSITTDTVSVPVHPGTPTEVVPTTAGDTYVFVKNTSTTNFVQVRRIVGPADYAKLNPGEFIFLCVYDSMGMQLLADTEACVVEYITFLKA
jgi:hypothetical protein